MLSIQFYQGVQRGFGTGFGDGGHVPIAVAQQVGSSDPKVVVAATSLNAPKISAAEDVGRLVFSFAVLIGIIYFWYLVMSKVGTF